MHRLFFGTGERDCDTFVPQLRTLEPRLVLNATAELVDAIGLRILGDAADDLVQINLVNGNTAIQLSDSLGNIIPIEGHDGGSTGSDTDPLPVTQIPLDSVSVDLGAGDDRLNVQLPDQVNLRVVDGFGSDQVDLAVLPTASPSPQTDVDIDADAINLRPTGALIQFADRDVRLNGLVTIDDSSPTGRTQIDVGAGTIEITGSFQLPGDVRFTGDSGSVLLGSATTSGLNEQVGVSFEFDRDSGAMVELGEFDDSAGHLVQTLRIDAAADARLQGSIATAERLSIDVSAELSVSENVQSGAIDFRATDIMIESDVRSQNGSILMIAGDELSVDGDIDTTAATDRGDVSLSVSSLSAGSLSAGAITFGDHSITTSSADITINGSATLRGGLNIETAFAAAMGGDLRITGNVAASPMLASFLNINTVGTTNGGEVRIDGDVGSSSHTDPLARPTDLSGIDIDAGSLVTRNLRVGDGDIEITAQRFQLKGELIQSVRSAATTGGSIRLNTPVEFERLQSTLLADGDLVAMGSLNANIDQASVRLSAEQVTALGIIRGGETLDIAAATTIAIENQVTDWQTIRFSANQGLVFGGSDLVAGSEISIETDVRFTDQTTLRAGQTRFEGDVDVAQLVTVESQVSDSAGQTSVEKRGTGTLVLASRVFGQTDLSISEGTVRVDGVIADNSTVTINRGGVLAGSGKIQGRVQVNGGTIAPSDFVGGSEIGRLAIGSLSFDNQSTFQADVSGSLPGETFDSITVLDGPIELGGASLDSMIDADLAGDTELLILQNETDAAINGRLTIAFDQTGAPLATPRELVDGALVFVRFGTGVAAVPAYLTYFGGDGNDVTIVTAGDHVQQGGQVNLIDRVGVNLRVRQGETQAIAQAAEPTIRPIAGLNGQNLIVQAMRPETQLVVDVNGFVDDGTLAEPLHVQAEIRFEADGVGTDFTLQVIDSDPDTPDRSERVEVTYQTPQATELRFDYAGDLRPDFVIRSERTSTIDVDLPSDELMARLTDQSDQAVWQSDPNNETSLLDVSSAGLSSRLRFVNPSQVFEIDAGQGDDRVTVGALASPLSLVPSIVGSSGEDSIVWNTDGVFENLDASNDFLLSAESIRVLGDIGLAGGSSMRMIADNELVIASQIDSGIGRIDLQSQADMSDLSASVLKSAASSPQDASVVLRGRDFLVGDVFAANGSFVLGNSRGLINAATGTIGNVTQTPQSRIEAGIVIATSLGSLQLDAVGNALDEVDLQATGAIRVLDSEADLVARASSGNSLEIQTGGDLVVDRVVSLDESVRLSTTGRILGSANQTGVHISSRVIELVTGVAFPNQTFAASDPLSIGTPATPVRTSASERVDASTLSTGGDIYLESPRLVGDDSVDGDSVDGVLRVGLIESGSGLIELTGESIDGASSDDDVDLAGSQISLNANSGIGALQSLTVTSVDDLRADTTTGSIRMDLVADRNINLANVRSGGGTDSEIDIRHRGHDRLSVSRVVNESGRVKIVTENASIDVLETVDRPSVFAGDGGQVLLETRDINSDIIVRGDVANESGDLDIRSRRNLALTAPAEIRSLGGTVHLVAGFENDNPQTVLNLQTGSRVDAGLGNAELDSVGDVYISSIVSGSSGEAIRIVSATGEIVDSGDQRIDLIADAGITRLTTASGIGHDNTLETSIDRLFARVNETGAIRLIESTDIELAYVSTFDGSQTIVATGTLVATDVRSENRSGLDVADNDRDISLETLGQSSDILVGQIQADGGADVRLVSADDILARADVALVFSDDLALIADNATGDSIDSVRLIVDVNQLEARVGGTARGDVNVRELNSIQLASSDNDDDTQRVVTANGQIVITAGDRILVTDSGGVNDGNQLRADPELVAGGANGRITLRAGSLVSLGDSVQLLASQSTAGAVRIDGPQVELGQKFQITTGQNVGVARLFAPRPGEGLTDTAFYDDTTVTTSGLEQAAINDATGVLSLDVGHSGERGLTINIDWGTETNRFQQIDSLSGDAPPLSVQHLYLEDEILESRLNGRVAATDPLEVRFAVRHHESILVTGTTIQQFQSDTESVEGELISSTDNPQTFESPTAPTLENGVAQFIIPNLTIPVAFFPVRDVIPVIDQDPVIVTNHQSFLVLGSGFESVDAVVSGTTTREEYFQLRVLSPDPSGDDLTEPIRLADDIINGDNLQRLFLSLPDGRYELQYVLGDGDVRTLLNVDLRDGKPISLSDELDETPEGGPLRLIPVEPTDSDDDSAEPERKQPDDDEPHDQTDDQNAALDVIGPDTADWDSATESTEIQPFSTAGRLLARWLHPTAESNVDQRQED